MGGWVEGWMGGCVDGWMGLTSHTHELREPGGFELIMVQK